MPRALHDTALDTRTSRGRLRPRRDPYWRRISACCHLGYRRHQNGGGSWVVRFYDGSRYIKETIATADDQRDSDGAKVLTFSEAQQNAQSWFADQARRAAGIEAEPPGRCTVARCMAEYLDWLSVHRKSAASARYSIQAHVLPAFGKRQLTRLRVSDYSAELGSVYIHEAKSKRPRHVYLNDEGVQVFEALTAGRFGNERLFRRADSEIWGKAHQIRRMELASEIARIEPAVSFHILRHTYASLYLMNGGDLPALAAQLGHSDTRMTVRHYGHLAESWRAEQARKHAPSFGLTDGANVVRLRRHPGRGRPG